MGWKNLSYWKKGLIIGGSVGGVIIIVSLAVLINFLINEIPSQPGSAQDIELMLFIISIGVILGSFIILNICSILGAIIGLIIGKIKSKNQSNQLQYTNTQK